MTTGIYQMTSPSGTIYIGQSRNIELRKRKYINGNCKSQPRVYRSILKYGFDNLNFTIIQQLPEDVEQSVLDEYERFYIAQYKEVGLPLMNLSSGGNANTVYCDEVRKNMSIAHVGEVQTIERRQKNSEQAKARYAKDPTKFNLTRWKVGDITDAHKAAVSKAHKGKVISAEQKAKEKATKEAKLAAGIHVVRIKGVMSVAQYSLTGEFIKAYRTMTEAESHGFKSGNISLCIAGKRKSHGGFIWKRL